MANVRTNRIMKDLQEFMNTSLDSGVLLTDYDEVELKHFTVSVAGPVGSPYETGTFDVKIMLPMSFPFRGPKAKFVTQVWHPNVGAATGNVCVDILTNWRAGTRLAQLAEVVQGLLSLPNPTSPLNSDASVELEENPREFERTATMWTCVFAGGSKPRPDELQVKVLSVQEQLQCSEEQAVKKLSFARWNGPVNPHV
ncbi:ubiquitin-conjugating enzyme E2 N-like [Thrips palmi]|uniref:Ubiquitin-conjugating enzyme E2 N-like n=1 Tax=Thrips palmi TaxID=161013 RepID=A0A6P8ZXM9_THRPL|nr:ubiquitin-conjugating enzyme E2 N-like [Thrips palmi]